MTRNERPWWAPDARGWIGIGVFALSVMLLSMMYRSSSFRNDEFVQTIATLVIGTAFVGGVVAWAYAATKGGGELADRNATIVEKQASVPTGTPADPINTKDVTP
jgi:multisubunit Na+/H+ antiporter MnhB subunit